MNTLYWEGDYVEERVRTTALESTFRSESCEKCSEELGSDALFVQCPRCRSLHHRDCWSENGGCARRGCPQLAALEAGRIRQTDGPPPGIPRSWFLIGAALIVAIVTAFVLRPSAPDPAAGRQRVLFLTEASVQEFASLERFAEAFNNGNSDLYLELSSVPYGFVDQKLVILMAARQTPDIFTLTEERYQQYLEHDILLPLPDADFDFGHQHPSQPRIVVVSNQTADTSAALRVLGSLIAYWETKGADDANSHVH